MKKISRIFIFVAMAVLIILFSGAALAISVRIQSIKPALEKDPNEFEWMKKESFVVDLGTSKVTDCYYKISEKEDNACWNKITGYNQENIIFKLKTRPAEWKKGCDKITIDVKKDGNCKKNGVNTCWINVCARYNDAEERKYEYKSFAESYSVDFQEPEIIEVKASKEKPTEGEKIKFTIEAKDTVSELSKAEVLFEGNLVGSCNFRNKMNKCTTEFIEVPSSSAQYMIKVSDYAGNEKVNEYDLSVTTQNKPPSLIRLECITPYGNCPGKVKVGDKIKLKIKINDIDNDKIKLVCVYDDVSEYPAIFFESEYTDKNTVNYEIAVPNDWNQKGEKKILCYVEDERELRSSESMDRHMTINTEQTSGDVSISISKSPEDIDNVWSSEPAAAFVDCELCQKTYIGEFDTNRCPRVSSESRLDSRYQEASEMEITSHKYVCAAGVTDSGGLIFTNPVEFKVSITNIKVEVVGVSSATLSCTKKEQSGPNCDSSSYKMHVSYAEINDCVELNEGYYTSYTSARPIAKKAWVCAYAKDEAGNAAYSEATLFDIEDETAPEISNVSFIKLAGSTKIIFECYDDESGCNNAAKAYFFSQINPVICPDSYSDYIQASTITDTGYVCVGQKNKAGLFGYAGPYSVTVDKKAPDVSISGAPSSWTGHEINALVLCKDKIASGRLCKSDSYAWKSFDSRITECPKRSTASLYTPGSYFAIDSYKWVCAYAEDSIGTPGYYGPVEFKIDDAAPVVTISGIPSSSVSSAKIGVSCSDSGSECNSRSYRLKEVTETTTDCSEIAYENYNIKSIPYKFESNTWLCAAAKDNAGNIGYSSPAQVVLRAIKPEVEVIASPRGVESGWKNIGSAAVSCSSRQGSCKPNSNKLIVYENEVESCPQVYDDYKISSPKQITKQSWVCAAAKDNYDIAGFSEPKEFRVDATAPAVKVTGEPAGWQKSSATAGISCTDKESGCASGKKKMAIYYASPPSECPGANSFGILYTYIAPQKIESEAWICAAAQDNAGNIGVTETPAHFKIGDNLLDISVTGAPDAWQSAAQRATITCSSEENEILCKTSSIRVKRMQSETACPISYSSYSESAAGGIYMVSDYTWLCAAAKDSSGKVEGFTSYPVQFRVDKTKPTVSIRGAPIESVETAYAYIECQDMQSGCDENSYGLLFQAGSNACTKDTSEYEEIGSGQLSVPTSGYVCGFAKDRAGNVKFAGPVAFSSIE